MKKILLIPIIFFTTILGFLNFSAENSLVDKYSNPCLAKSIFVYETENSNSDSVIALLLYNEINNAIQNYFGEPTQFALYDAEITEITQINNEFAYRVTIEVPTFNGPHNPPYGIETLTFAISPNSITLENYEHKNVII
ncbi:MAG: DUF3888 domain-containing protein [Clostridia bacterium]|nr:DUF3888 domain-containing protein [Clostridia bacterium]